MKSIKPHSHQDRQQIVDQLIPYLQKTYKDNLLALGAEGSYSRGEDQKFSDLELICFVKNYHQ